MPNIHPNQVDRHLILLLITNFRETIRKMWGFLQPPAQRGQGGQGGWGGAERGEEYLSICIIGYWKIFLFPGSCSYKGYLCQYKYCWMPVSCVKINTLHLPLLPLRRYFVYLYWEGRRQFSWFLVSVQCWSCRYYWNVIIHCHTPSHFNIERTNSHNGGSNEMKWKHI